MIPRPARFAVGHALGWPDAARIRRRVTWLKPSITYSRLLGGIRRQRTWSAAKVQGNSPKLSQPSSPRPSSATSPITIVNGD